MDREVHIFLVSILFNIYTCDREDKFIAWGQKYHLKKLFPVPLTARIVTTIPLSHIRRQQARQAFQRVSSLSKRN